MRLKIECPTHFIKDFKEITADFVIDNTDPQILITDPGSYYKYDEEYLKQFKNLVCLTTPSTGVTHIDLDYCQRAKIKVLNLFLDRSMLNNIYASSEFTWMHILNSFRFFDKGIKSVHEGHWRNKEEELRGYELFDKTIGIIGFGRIGSNIARYANTFGMNVVFYDPYVKEYPIYCQKMTLEEVAKQSDIVSVNPYLTTETNKMINADFLSLCKKGCRIVNTSRGEVVDEVAICSFVENGIVQYSTDVVCNEQEISKFHESKLFRLFQDGKITVTPHIAGATYESQYKAFVAMIGIIRNFMKAGE